MTPLSLIWARSNLPAPVAEFKKGDVLTIGEFFWIGDQNFVGYDFHRVHGHGVDEDDTSPGSVSPGCTFTVRAVKNGYAIGRLDRPEMPYGAQAPIGTLFQVPLSRVRMWAEQLDAIRDREAQKAALAKDYCK